MDPQDFGVDFCGPYISGGKWQSSVCSTHTARSAEEQCCKEHDCCYNLAGSSSGFTECDAQFGRCNDHIGSVQSSINKKLVSTFGDYFHSNKMKRSAPQDDVSSWTCNYCDTPNFIAMEQCGVCGDPYDIDSSSPIKVRSVGSSAPYAPKKSNKRLRLDKDDVASIKKNLIHDFDLMVDPSVLRRRRQFSRLPRWKRRKLAQLAQRRWRLAYAKKQRLKWRNNYFRKRSGYASKIQRSFRKFLWRKKFRKNSLRRLRFEWSPSKGLRRYYTY